MNLVRSKGRDDFLLQIILQGIAEDEMVGWHHCPLSQWTGDGEGQEGLVCWSP